MSGTCLIVGYGKRLGHGIARAFGRAGHPLALIGRSVGGGGGALAELRGLGVEVAALPADAGNFAALATTIGEAERMLGPIEVAIYNVVVERFGTPLELDPDAIASDLRADAVGAVAMARAVLPGMQARGGGSILLVGSGWGHRPDAFAASIAAGKAALRSLAFSLHEAAAGSGVRAGMLSVMGPIAPGTAFDPDAIGEAFLARHREPVQGFAAETFFRGTGDG